MSDLVPITWRNKEEIIILDQRKLPHKEVYVVCKSLRQVIGAIRRLVIRGAPAIGLAIAMGLALEAKNLKVDGVRGFIRQFEKLCQKAKKARPTAVNLSWAIERMRAVIIENPGADADFLKEALYETTDRIRTENIEQDEAIGKHGEKLLKDGMSVITYCNTGTLATGGCGTALGIIRRAWSSGKRVKVYACETRPLLQGSRLTAWELLRDNIPVTLLADNAAGYLMARKKVDISIVGADRIAMNGDTANKIGTYPLALVAHENRIPFYVAAPLSTVDPSVKKGEGIPIEERKPQEIIRLNGRKIAPDGVEAYNPAFDITPQRLITGIITENGIAMKPLGRNLRQLFIRS